MVEINIATAFYWRHKIVDAIRKFVGDGSLEGVVELDETYFALSYKGNDSKITTFTMPRESRKRGYVLKFCTLDYFNKGFENQKCNICISGKI